MKLLFGQNLSFRLCDALGELFPGSTQVRRLGLERADDLTIWRRAEADAYVLVTQDTDFRDLSALYGAPPKVVLLRCGNQPTAVIVRLLREHADQVIALGTSSEVDLLEIG